MLIINGKKEMAKEKLLLKLQEKKTVTKLYQMLGVIGYHLYNLRSMKNTHGAVLLLAEACNFTKRRLVHGCFSRFLD